MIFPQQQRPGNHLSRLWWIGAFLGCLVLTGGAGTLIHGMIGLVVACFIWIRPPDWTISARFEKLLAACVLWALTGWLPQWILPHGDWREACKAQGIVLPFCEAVEPWLSFEGLVWLAALAGALSWLLSRRPYPEDRKLVLWVFALMVFILGVFSIAGQMMHLKYWAALDSPVFSFFPSRNQSATLFVLGGTISAGLMVYQLRHQHWLRGAIAIIFVGTLFYATILTTSRAGVLCYFVGISGALYLGAPALRGQQLWQVMIPTLLIAFFVLLITASDRLDRFKSFFRHFGSDYRIPIYMDALRMTKDSWLSGVGWNHFPLIFNFYRESSILDLVVLHPESDWLWWTCEMGIVGLGLAIALIVLALKGIFPFHHRRYESIRAIGTAALLPFFFHTLIDVPGHSSPIILSVFFIYSIAWNWGTGAPSLLPPSLWRLVALFIGIGSLAVIARCLISMDEKEQLHKAISTGDNANALTLVQKEIKREPLNCNLYVDRGKLIFLTTDSINQAKADFNCALFLDSCGVQIPYNIGLFWKDFSPREAYFAWNEAIKRSKRFPKSLYHDLWVNGFIRSDFQTYASLLCKTYPALSDYVIKQGAGQGDSHWFKEEITHDPQLSSWSLIEQREILYAVVKADPQLIYQYLATRDGDLCKPLWWDIYALAAGNSGHWEEACRICEKFAPAPQLPETSGILTRAELKHRLQENHSDWLSASALLSMEVNAGNWDDVADTLSLLEDQPTSPPYVYYWRGRVLADKNAWKESWASWEKFLALTAVQN